MIQTLINVHILTKGWKELGKEDKNIIHLKIIRKEKIKKEKEKEKSSNYKGVGGRNLVHMSGLHCSKNVSHQTRPIVFGVGSHHHLLHSWVLFGSLSSSFFCVIMTWENNFSVWNFKLGIFKFPTCNPHCGNWKIMLVGCLFVN